MKKIISVAMSLAIVLSASSMALATEHSYQKKILTVKEVGEAVNNLSRDGKLSAEDIKIIEKSATKESVEEYVSEKIQETFALAGNLTGTVELTSSTNGIAYEKREFKLANGATLTMEFEDGAEEQANPIITRAVNGETVWKDYGNRYFTAKATVNVGLGSASIGLENHYILSENGIDENYGKQLTYISTGTTPINVAANGCNIIDASARTLGKSNVNMEGYFSVQGKEQGHKDITLSTAVKYVDHNKAAKQIKVKHSWSLS